MMLNSIKRLLDVQRPKIEAQMRGWVACLPTEIGTGSKGMFGERFNEVTVELRAKYKNYLQAIVDKLADNVRIGSLKPLDAGVLVIPLTELAQYA